MDDAFAIRGGEVLLVLRLYPVKQDALDMDSAGTDIAFRSVRFVSHRVSAGLSLRYLKHFI